MLFPLAAHTGKEVNGVSRLVIGMGGANHCAGSRQIHRIAEISNRLGIGSGQLLYRIGIPFSTRPFEHIDRSRFVTIVIVSVGPDQDGVPVHHHAAAEEVIGLPVVSAQHGIRHLVTPATGRLLVDIDRTFKIVLTKSSNHQGLAIVVQRGAIGVAAIEAIHTQGRLQVPGCATTLEYEHLSRNQGVVFSRGTNDQRIPFQRESSPESPARALGRSDKLLRLGHGRRPSPFRLDIDIDRAGVRSIFVVIQGSPEHNGVTTDSK